MAPKRAVFNCNFTAVETVQQCLPAAARMLRLSWSSTIIHGLGFLICFKKALWFILCNTVEDKRSTSSKLISVKVKNPNPLACQPTSRLTHWTTHHLRISQHTILKHCPTHYQPITWHTANALVNTLPMHRPTHTLPTRRSTLWHYQRVSWRNRCLVEILSLSIILLFLHVGSQNNFIRKDENVIAK